MRNGIPNLSALQAFEASARLGSFSRAAEELSLTHSAVYRQVASLEARLGVQLFTRVRRRIALTEHGAEYAGRIRHHLDQIEKDTFGLVSRTGMGRSIHIAVVPTLATTWLIPRLPDFQRAHPDITVSLSVRTLPFQFKDQPFDGALYHGDGLWPGTQARCCSPSASWCRCARRAGRAHHRPRRRGAGRPDAPAPELAAGRLASVVRGQSVPVWSAGGGRAALRTVHDGDGGGAGRTGRGPDAAFPGAARAGPGALALPVPQSLTVSQGYFFGYPQRSERSEALKLFEAWLQAAAAGVGAR